MIYLLFYDTDNGSREEWNTFYTPVEAFSSEELRNARKAKLMQAVDDEGEDCEYNFHEVEVEVDA